MDQPSGPDILHTRDQLNTTGMKQPAAALLAEPEPHGNKLNRNSMISTLISAYAISLPGARRRAIEQNPRFMLDPYAAFTKIRTPSQRRTATTGSSSFSLCRAPVDRVFSSAECSLCYGGHLGDENAFVQQSTMPYLHLVCCFWCPHCSTCPCQLLHLWSTEKADKATAKALSCALPHNGTCRLWFYNTGVCCL